MKFERKHDWLDIASFAAIGVAAAAVVAGVVYISKKCRDYIECADLLDDECDCGCECDDDCCCDDACDCGCDCEDQPDADLSVKTMFVMAVATSIDALAVGISLAMAGNVNIWFAIVLIGVITFLMSALGVKIGNVFGSRFEQKAQIAGGVILILLGVKILLEHLGIL